MLLAGRACLEEFSQRATHEGISSVDRSNSTPEIPQWFRSEDFFRMTSQVNSETPHTVLLAAAEPSEEGAGGEAGEQGHEHGQEPVN